MAAVPPPLGARPHPNQNDMSASGSVISQRFVCSLARCEDNKCASKAHEAARKARKDRSERARCVSVEGPDEPHSRSARNEETGLSFRVRTSRLCPCVVMRGLRYVPRSKIRGSKLYNTDIGIKLLARRIGRRVAHWRCGPKDRCAGLKNV